MANSLFNFTPLKVALLLFSATSLAGEREQRIIQKSVNAYGGNNLLQLKSIKYTDELLQFFESQSGHALQGSHTAHLNQVRVEVSKDFIHQRSELKRQTTRLVGNHGSKAQTTTHRVFQQNQGYSVDHCLQSYRINKRINFQNADLGYSQMLDTLLIRQLAENENRSQWVDTAYIQGQAHDVITINQGKDNEYSVYLNQTTGHLTRMLQKRGTGFRHYDFLQHTQTDGITWAQQMFVSANNHPVYHTQNRRVQFNLKPHSSTLPNYPQAEPEQWFNVSELTARQLADDVYFVGQDWGYTLFIDIGEHYLSAGAWGPHDNAPAWQQALAQLQQFTGESKPVGQHLVSHHHTDHMSGLTDIVAHKATLLLHPNHIKGVEVHLKSQGINPQFQPVVDKQSLAQGKVLLLDVPTSHASHNLVIYLPESQILFSEDLFGSSLQTAHHSPSAWPFLDSYQRLETLLNKIEEQGLKVKQYVSSHHGRILSQKEIDEAMEMKCPTDEALSLKLFNNQ